MNQPPTPQSEQSTLDVLMTRLLGCILRWRAVSTTDATPDRVSIFDQCAAELMEAAGIVELEHPDAAAGHRRHGYSISGVAGKLGGVAPQTPGYGPGPVRDLVDPLTPAEVEDLAAAGREADAGELVDASLLTLKALRRQEAAAFEADLRGIPSRPMLLDAGPPVPDLDSLDFATATVFQDFSYSHLPPAMQAVSRQFHMLACWLIANTPTNPKRTTALNKLVESKDYAVRSTRDVVSDGPNRKWRMTKPAPAPVVPSADPSSPFVADADDYGRRHRKERRFDTATNQWIWVDIPF